MWTLTHTPSVVPHSMHDQLRGLRKDCFWATCNWFTWGHSVISSSTCSVIQTFTVLPSVHFIRTHKWAVRFVLYSNILMYLPCLQSKLTEPLFGIELAILMINGCVKHSFIKTSGAFCHYTQLVHIARYCSHTSWRWNSCKTLLFTTLLLLLTERLVLHARMDFWDAQIIKRHIYYFILISDWRER